MPDREYADPDTGEVTVAKYIQPPPRPQPAVDVPQLALNSASTAELTKALIVAQGLFKPIARESTAMATQTRSYKYAPLEAIIAATKEGMLAAGLVITQTTMPAARGAILVTMLQHTSGEWKASYWPLSTNGRSQEQGSELTYARRYQRCAILDIQPEDADDDGAATKEAPPAPQKVKPYKRPQPDVANPLDGVDKIEPAPWAKGSEPIPDGMSEYVGIPVSVTTKPTAKGGNAYRVYFKDVVKQTDEWFGTFDKDIAALCEASIGKANVRIIYSTSKFGKKIEEVRPHD